MKEPEENPYIRDPELDFEDAGNLTEKEAEKQVKLLREALKYHDYRYYVENDPVISDKAYDILIERLGKIENLYELESDTSPTQKVGGGLGDGFESREHVTEMLSINASENEEEIKGFDERVREKAGEIEYHLEPKFDGLSIEFVYEDGNLEAAVTRGNGVKGEDVTENIKTINTVALNLHNAPETLVVRAEVYMPIDGFQKLNKERVERGKQAFSNPRNAAAGTLRHSDASVVAERPLDVYFYDLMSSSQKFKSQKEVMKLFNRLGLKTSRYNRLSDSIEDFIDYRDEMMERREDLNYEIDGVIAKVNSFRKRGLLGETSAYSRWAFAYKFPAKTDETTVEEITVQVGRTGKLTPVALLRPVDVKGVTISRASLHNEKQAQKLGVSRGAKVTVERSGDVIPQVKEVIEEGKENFELPKKCPVCGSKVIGEKEHHFCTGGISCPAQLKRKLEYFASEKSMDIKGLGEKLAEELVDQGLIEEIPDLYSIKKGELVKMDGQGEKSAQNLLEEIEASKDVDLASFLTALGIRHVGKKTARDISEKHSLDELMEIDKEELMKLENIGPEAAESIDSFFNGAGRDMVEKLIDAGVKPKSIEVEDGLEGLKIVITGGIEGFTRSELIKVLENNGADVTSSVSSKTDYLVVGKNPSQLNREKARQEGVEEISEKQFREKILAGIQE